MQLKFHTVDLIYKLNTHFDFLNMQEVRNWMPRVSTFYISLTCRGETVNSENAQ